VKNESFEERHRDNISRLKLVLIVTCLIAIPVTFWVNHEDVGHVNNRVNKVESPCLKYASEKTQKNKRRCEESFEKAVLTITHAEACAILRKAGLEIQNCAGARLRQERGRRIDRNASAGGGDATSTPSPGHSLPAPPSGGAPGHEGHSGPEHQLHPEQPSSSPEPTPPVSESPKASGPIRSTVEGVTETVHGLVCSAAPVCP